MSDWLERFRALSREEHGCDNVDDIRRYGGDPSTMSNNVDNVTGISTSKEPPDQLTRARKATRHPLPQGAPTCAACHLLLAGAGIRRGRDLYHPVCLKGEP
jgi:hypothetical protein